MYGRLRVRVCVLGRSRSAPRALPERFRSAPEAFGEGAPTALLERCRGAPEALLARWGRPGLLGTPCRWLPVIKIFRRAGRIEPRRPPGATGGFALMVKFGFGPRGPGSGFLGLNGPKEA